MNSFILLTMFLVSQTSDVWIPNYVNGSTIEVSEIETKGYGEVEFLVKLTNTIYDYDKEARNNPIILDIGANEGNFTIGVAQLYLNSKIYSFEPFKLCLDVILRRTSHFDNVEVVNEAVSNVTMLNHPFYSISYDASPKITTSSLLENQQGYSVCDYANTTTLSDFMEKKNISKIFFIKIDTEGFDGPIILNSFHLFAEHKVKYLYFEYVYKWIEVNPEINVFHIIELLKGVGYNVYYESKNNFIPVYDKIQVNFMGYCNILAVLRGEPFERNMMSRLCKYCKYT